MKTKAQVIKDNMEYKTLVNAVVNRIGIEGVRDVNNHGISVGFDGFIYYADTVRFFNRHKKDIMRMAEDMSQELGEDLLAMIQGFNCLSTNFKPDYTANEIARAIYAVRGERAERIKNAMAWFAAEEVCRMFED